MPSIDERIVTIHFDNVKFEQNIAKTIASLGKLNEALKMAGATHGLQSLETASNNVKMTTAQQSAANLKKSTDFTASANSIKGIETASNQVKMTGAKAAADDAGGRFSRLADTARAALDRVKSTLTLGGKSASDALQLRDPKGQFAAIEASSHQVKLAGITTAVSEAQKSFSVLKGAASVAFGSIAADAARKGAQAAKSLVGPISGGFSEYETNINSVQTIMANTEGQKGSGLKGTNKALDELNHYADKTIYSFSEMAKNVGTFTAAGVNLGDAVPAIKGISNLAAVSGSNSQQASTAMYQLSQALSSGKVGLQDWNSVVNAGMGGKLFQKAIVRQAQTMGTLKGKVEGLDDPMKKLTIDGHSFREAIQSKPGQKSFFTSDVLSGVLKNLSGDMSEAQIKAQGFTAAQAKAIAKQAKMAEDAATTVKTFTGLKDATTEAIGSGYSASFKLILGDFGDAKKLFTGINRVVGGIVQDMSNSRNNLLKSWVKLGGRTDMLDGFKMAFSALGTAIKAVSQGFRSIFPKTTGQELANASKSFQAFAATLKERVINNFKLIHDISAGVFAAFSIGFQIVKRIVGVFVDLGSAVGGVSGGGFKALISGVSGFLVAVDKALKSGKGFTDILATLPDFVKAPLIFIANLARAIKNLFTGGGDIKKFGGNFDAMGKKMHPLEALTQAISGAWEAFKNKVSDTFSVIQPGITKIKAAFGQLGHSIIDAFNNADYGVILSGIQTGLLGGILVMFKKFFKGGVLGAVVGEKGGGMFKEIGESFGALTGYLKTMQMQVQANILLKIAIALGILTISIIALSGIDAQKLDRSMSALTIAFTQLAIATSIVTKIAAGPGAVKMPILAAGMILLAVAMRILVSSVQALAKLDYEQLKKGLGGVAVLFGIMAAAAIPLGAAGAKIVFAGVGMVLIATAMRILTKAIQSLSKMSWEDLGKGLATMAGALIIVIGAVALMPVTLPLIAYGMITFSAAINILAKAIIKMGSVDGKVIGLGLTAMAGSLAIIAVAIMALPPTMIAQATGLLVMAAAISSVAKTLTVLGKMAPVQVLTSLYSLGGALAVLAAGLYAMNGALGGATALILASVGLKALVGSVVTLGSMPLVQLLQGLGAIVVGLGALAVTASILAPTIPLLLALGASILIMGVGIGAATGGIAKLVDALTGLVKVVQKSGGNMGDAFKGLGEGLKQFFGAIFDFIHNLVVEVPKAIAGFVVNLGKALAAIVTALPKFALAVVQLLNTILDVIIKTAPKLGQAAVALGLAILNTLDQLVPKLITVGIKLINALLTGLNGNLEGIVTMAGNIIIKLLNALAIKLPAIVQAGGNVIVNFLNGIATQYPRIYAAATRMVVAFAQASVTNAPRLVSAAVTIVTTYLNAIAGQLPRLIRAGVHLVSQFLKGVGDNADRVANSAATMMGQFIEAAANAVLRFVDKIGQVILNFLNGIEQAIRKYQVPISRAGGRIAKALIDGMVQGITDLGGVLRKAIEKVFTLLPGWAKDVLGIHSPSTVFAELGRFTVQGFANGITDTAGVAKAAVTDMTNSVIDGVSGKPMTAMQKSMRDISSALGSNINMDPTITPVLDLTNVEAGAQRLNTLTNVTPISAASSFGQANAISADQVAAAEDAAATTTDTPKAAINFVQNNHSPDKLSETEIYRQTKNQLSQAQSALDAA